MHGATMKLIELSLHFCSGCQRSKTAGSSDLAAHTAMLGRETLP